MNSSLRAKENLHIVFWLLKDFAWISDFKVLGVSMAVPTFFLSLWITWLGRADRINDDFVSLGRNRKNQ